PGKGTGIERPDHFLRGPHHQRAHAEASCSRGCRILDLENAPTSQTYFLSSSSPQLGLPSCLGVSKPAILHGTRAKGPGIERSAFLWHIRDVVIAFFFLLGIVIGSFLNVCITRIPEGISIVSPGSRCPECSAPIKPYDNVPLFAWLWLHGKCRSCKHPISAMYPLIELITGL